MLIGNRSIRVFLILTLLFTLIGGINQPTKALAASGTLEVLTPTMIVAGTPSTTIRVQASSGSTLQASTFTKVDIVKNGIVWSTGVNSQIMSGILTFTIPRSFDVGMYALRLFNDGNEYTGSITVVSASSEAGDIAGPAPVSITIEVNGGAIYEGYSSSTITVTGTNIMLNDSPSFILRDTTGNVYNTFLTNVQSTAANKLSIQLLPGLTEKVYSLTVSSASATASAVFMINKPTIRIEPAIIPSDYRNQSLHIVGRGTAFTAGYSAAIYNAQAQDTGKAGVLIVNSPTQLSLAMQDGLSPGVYTIIVQSPSGITMKETLTISNPTQNISPIASYSIDAQGIMLVGTNVQARLLANHADRTSTLVSRDVVWTSTRNSVAAIQSNGTLAALSVGETILRATLSGETVASTTIVVTDRIVGELPNSNVRNDADEPDDANEEGPVIVTPPAADTNAAPAPPVVEVVVPAETLNTNSDRNKGRIRLNFEISEVILAIEASTESRFRIVTEETTDGVEAIIPSEVLRKLMAKGDQSELEVSLPGVTYVLPLGLLQANRLLTSGAAELRIVIERATQEQQTKTESQVKGQGARMLAPVTEFQVFVVQDNGETELTDFGQVYVERSFTIANNNVNYDAISGVTIDADGTIRHVPTKISLTADGQLWVTLRRNGNSLYTVLQRDSSFKDLAVKHWAKPYVDVMAAKWIISGKNATTFDPEGRVTRAEFAAMIARALGIRPIESVSQRFVDVPLEAWFAGEVEAAYAAGIISGRTAERFDPAATISRQEMTVMIMRAMEYAGKKSILPASSTLSAFGDQAKIDGYARTAMAQAVELGLMSGIKTTILEPKGTATRAQAATIILRMLRMVEWVN